MSRPPLALVLALITMVGPVRAASDGGTPTGVREVTASARNLVPLQTRLRYTTMIVLPDGEEILDLICGDKDFWVVSGTHNIAYVKPAKEGAATNLNIVTASGAIYSFLVTEKAGTGVPDLKVYINADQTAASAKPKYYTAAQVDELRGELMQQRAAVEAAAQHANERIAAFQQEYPTEMQFAYGAPRYEKPFLVRAIWNDGRFTYLQTDATELPALYEVKDGDPALVNFQVHGHTYVVPKLLERGYLALGKSRFEFAQGH
jgi:type IV secretory pathway VirB9-like protein